MTPPSTRTARGSDYLGIDRTREAELSYYAGRIMLEVYQEEGEMICRHHIVRAVLSSPYLRDELERVYVAAALCELLPSPKYEYLLAVFMQVEAEFKGKPIEDRVAIWIENIKSSGGLP